MVKKSLQIYSTLVSKSLLLNCYVIYLSRYLRLRLNKKRHLEEQMEKWKKQHWCLNGEHGLDSKYEHNISISADKVCG